MTGVIICVIATLIFIILIARRKKTGNNKVVLSENFREILQAHVAYYRLLNNADKLRFENKIKEFLSYVRIHGVNTEIYELDKLLVASSAVIPVFAFNWHYHNLRDVLIYADTFNREYSVTAEERNVWGMVGTGAMANVHDKGARSYNMSRIKGKSTKPEMLV